MRISAAEEQQDLITQIYFKGDPHNEKDPCASSSIAVNRILNVTKNKNNEKAIHFNVAMAKEFKPEDTVFKKLSGVYGMNDNSLIEFLKKEFNLDGIKTFKY
jgi:catechol 1,2-dioxygenase